MRTARAKNAAAVAARRVTGHARPASGTPPRKKVFEQDRRRAGVQIGSAAMSGFGRGESLVVEIDGETERGTRIGKAAHALRLRSVLATQRQGETDDQGTHLFFRDQVTEGREVGLEVAARQRAQRPRESEGVVADGESDAAIADVQRKISHAQGEADVVVESTLICRRESKNGKRGHQ